MLEFSPLLNSMDRLVHGARLAQAAWAKRPVGERVEVVSRFADLLSTNVERCAAVLTRDTGKPLGQSRNEVKATVNRVEFFASEAADALADRVVTRSEGMKEVIVREPLGVIANVSAWNFPYFIGTNVWAPGLLAGNAVVYKPSEHALGTANLVAELWREAGVPENCFVVAGNGSPRAGAELVESDVDGIFFTGSYATGKKIAASAAPRMIKLQLELGGKDAAYVADDFSEEMLSTVAASLADGACYNAGQSCCSIERIYVHEAVYDTFLHKLAKTVDSFSLGSEWSPDTFVGPLCLPNQPAFLQAQVDDAVSKGAKVVTGKARAPTPRHFTPTVLADVTDDMDVVRVESFGPVVAVAKVKDDEEAVTMANNSDYGLTVGIYCADERRALDFLAKTKTGSAYWNCCDRTSPTLPWSGRGASGIGVTMSTLGIETFTHPRGYHLRTSP